MRVFQKFVNFVKTIDRRVWWIVVLSAILFFWRLSHVDMVGDDAHYSARAVGMIDFMFATPEFQSTPLQWFESLPWWARLSFHDHPILIFGIQHFFLSLKENIFFAKLPSVIMALTTLVFTYIWVVRATKKNDIGVLATFLLALNAQFVWAARVSHLEIGVVFFLTFAMWGFWRFVEDKSKWVPLGIFLGLALLAKFTALFFIPSILFFLLLKSRDYFKSRELYLAFALVVVINSPTLVYNALMYQETGHFALQFVRLLGQSSPWHMGGIRTGNYFLSTIELFKNLGKLISWPYLVVALGATFLAMYRRSVVRSFLVICFFFLVIQHVLIGNDGNILTTFSIIFSPLIAIVAYGTLEKIKGTVWQKRFIYFFGFLFAIYSMLFVINSHVLVGYRGRLGWTYSGLSSNNFGVYQLDKYLDSLIAERGPWDSNDIYYTIKKVDPSLYKYITPLTGAERREQLKHSRIILFDNSINWFARVWLFERRRFYNNLPFVGVQEQKLLDQLKIRYMYFIRATNAAPLDGVSDEAAAEVENLFLAAGVKPFLIYRDDGKIAFKIYESDASALIRR